MRALTRSTGRKIAFRLGLLGTAALLSACQVVAPQASPRPLLGNGAGVEVAGVNATPSAPTAQSTFTIKRDTLQDSLSLTGKIVPGRSAQLAFHGNGTVTAVNVSAGQNVHQGDVLAEYALDDDSLQAARAQATLADLAYQSEQTKLEQLQSGTNKDSIQQLRITIEKDQADIQKLQQDRAEVQVANDRGNQALATARAAADKREALAEVGLQSAQDDLSAAQANLKQAQDDVVANQQKAAADQDQATADATRAVAAASAAVRAAQRQLDQATTALDMARSQPTTTRASQSLETQQLKVDQDKEALKDAQAAAESANGQSASTEHTARQIAAEVAAATANVRAAQRALAFDNLELKHQQANLASAQAADAAAIQGATYNVEALKEQLSNVQLAEQAAQQKADHIAKQASTKPAPNASAADATRLAPGQTSVQAAQAAVKQAEAKVRTATIELEDAQAAQAAAADATTSPAQFAEHALGAAQAQLSSDQARLNTLENGSAATEIAREQTRVNILRDQSIAATAAAQPTVVLTAPFDATVADVGMSPGQVLAPGAAAADSTGSDGRAAAIRLVAAGPNSIVANASETEVAQLDRGQQLDLTFPGLPGASATGKIVEIASTGSVSKDTNQVMYPVRIELPTAPPGVKFGMTAQASLSVSEAKNVLVAPRRAIRTVGGQPLLDKLDANGHAQPVPVQVGRSLGLNVELLSGVQEGDVVAIYDPITASPKQP